MSKRKQAPDAGMIGIETVVGRTGLTRREVTELAGRGGFPPSTVRGGVRVWRMADVRAWLRSDFAKRWRAGGGPAGRTQTNRST